jgi:hypothetical protein
VTKAGLLRGICERRRDPHVIDPGAAGRAYGVTLSLSLLKREPSSAT